ncbi:MAG: hypothetical protein M1812_007199 [Candelaria pacifica]|nr:MAG: hypothetical protein M1812_007199 [Candelaria pacifica]
MNAFKSYFHPAGKKEDGKKAASSNVEMKSSPMGPSTPGLSRKTTPVGTTPVGSRPVSRPASIYPSGDFRNSAADDVADIKADVMVNWLYQQQMEKLWTTGGRGEGVVLKKKKATYACCPRELEQDYAGLFDAVLKLNVRAAMTVNTQLIKVFLRRQDVSYVPLPDGLRLQILPDIHHLPQCQKHHFAAFIQDSAMLVVWDDEPRDILKRAEKIQTQLMELIWQENGVFTEKSAAESKNVLVTERPIDGSSSGGDVEELITDTSRRPVLIQPVMTALTLILLIAALGAGWRLLALQIAVDHNWMRLGLLAYVPIQVFLSLVSPNETAKVADRVANNLPQFFMQSVAGCLAQLFGPISQMQENSKFFSGVAPPRLNGNIRTLPHVTIQCPVYKEGLNSVIDPTVKSIKAAISTYEMQGGTANIFVNDDGMQLIPDHDAQMRRDFYEEHNIGWVARPKHNPKPAEGETAFVRKGKFKKASNMNYALSISNRVEEKLERINRHTMWSQEDENLSYHECLKEVIAEDEGRTWAEGNIRVGDYILLSRPLSAHELYQILIQSPVDSDTRVPVDCFLDAVSEMEISPEVAIIQYSSGVMNVTNSYFENGITFFTNLIYTAITFAVANGDVAPFVGHNAVLRWSAMQHISYQDEDGRDKFWSESTVSEDFDMALRLQSMGHIIRLGAYQGQGFKEGVSLTVYDELARWEKYAYGCNELIFHPIRLWIFKGPFTPLFRNFICSGMPLPSKITILAYIGTYYAIGSAWILTVLNYFLVGWFNGALDHWYLNSWKVYISIIVVFNGVANVALAVLRYRTENKTLFGAFKENFKWIPLLTVFLGGLSLHVSQAILCHMFEIDLSWGATAKEVENTSFFEEIPKLLKKFKFTFIFCLTCTAMMIVFSTSVVPVFWRINFFIAIFPLCTIVVAHFLLPIVLNPSLMLLTW